MMNNMIQILISFIIFIIIKNLYHYLYKRLFPRTYQHNKILKVIRDNGLSKYLDYVITKWDGDKDVTVDTYGFAAALYGLSEKELDNNLELKKEIYIKVKLLVVLTEGKDIINL